MAEVAADSFLNEWVFRFIVLLQCGCRSVTPQAQPSNIFARGANGVFHRFLKYRV
jgi:hypothetical protein